MRRLNRFFWIIWSFLFVLTAQAQAHTLNLTGVKVVIEKTGVTVGVVAHLHNLKTGDPAAEIARRLRLRLDGQPFSGVRTQLIRDPANGIVIWQARQARTAASPTGAIEVALDAPIFPEVAGQSTVLTVLKNRQKWAETVLDADHPTAVIGRNAKKSGVWPVAVRFGREGVLHIFGGIDHVLFLLSLLLLGGTWKQLLKIVTAFTLAHSITLSLAATGLFALPPRLVEPVIALSIVVVALTNFRIPPAEDKAQRRDLRPYLAFGFGLIHGFGFAGALSEIGLPHEFLGWALLSFNAGVEAGQAALVLLFAPVLAILAKRWPKSQFPLVRYGSATVALVGAFWFIQRVSSA